jgi:hypothetical protein
MPVKANHSHKKRLKAPNPEGKRGLPVSLYPLSFQDAVLGLAQTKMPESGSKKPPTKPAKGK